MKGSLPPVRVLLVGMMGSGKTTVGRALAGMTGWPYVDNDALVAELSGSRTADVEASRGGDALHEIEGEVVDRILTMPAPLVAGIPGSAIASEPRRERLRAGGHVVWLRASLDTLVARIGVGASRPFFAGRDVRVMLTGLYAGREPLYAASAAQVIDVDDLAPDEVARRILSALGAG